MRVTFLKLATALVFCSCFLYSQQVLAQTGATASFVGSDSATQGNWHAVYGADGYSVAQDSQSLPANGSFTVQNEQDYTWDSSTTDPRALQTGSGSGRIAAAWYSAANFSFDVNFTDGNAHQVALYAVDWDGQGRSETIQVLDTASSAVLATRTISNFANGVYFVWTISGHATINVIQSAGSNAVVSGVFFGGSSTINSAATFAKTDTTTQGNWHGAYGADGYSLANDFQSVPAYASFSPQNQANYTWAPSTVDPRGLQTGSGSGRIAATWYNSSAFTFDVNFTDGNQHQFALYGVDWDNEGRSETIQVLDAVTEAILDTRTISSFSNGVYLVWNITGHVKFNVIQSVGSSAVVSGVFFGGSSAVSSSAAYVRLDSTTGGNWHGAYGADGYSVANDSQSVPSYAGFSVLNQSNWTWDSSSGDLRALQTGNGLGRVAATWYDSSTFNFDVNFTDGNPHQFSLYEVDWDNEGRSETIQVLDAATEAILDTRSISNFSSGVYLVWNVSGHVKINVIQSVGANAVVSGVFFGGSSTVNSTATFARTDTATLGNWQGTYGADGYSVANDSQSLPAYASFALQNQAYWTWDPNPTDPRALQRGIVSGSIAATWYNNPSFSLDVNFTDGHTHQLALYAVDWDSQGRTETIQVLDAATEAVLDTENISGFTGGEYLVWNISGNVRINVIGASGPNAVISGAFFDSSPGGGGSTAPAITSLSPTSDPIGTVVAIAGTNFGAAQGTSTVTFNGIAATICVTCWNATSISATVPSGATTGNIVVTVGGVASNGVPFTVKQLVPGFAAIANNLNTPRGGQTATLLTNGQVLFAGGADSNYAVTLTSAELYDPATATFWQTGSLNTPRIYHTASLLNNGMVLISGGQNRTVSALASAELYGPASGTFVATSNMTTPRGGHTATVLNNGTVLLVGGVDINYKSLASAELYDPTTGTFTATGSLNTARSWQTATLLNNGTVLITGGVDANNNASASAELYDPTTGTFTATGSLNIARSSQTATLLNNGQVLIAEGFDTNFNFIGTAELYNPTAETFAYTGSPNVAREAYTATLLSNGMVLFAGGYDSSYNDLSSAELFDPATGTFTISNSLGIAPYLQTATLLTNGLVLIAGGFNTTNIALASAQLYTPNSLTPAGLVSIALSPVNPAIPLATAQPFTAVGTFSNGSTQTLASVIWNSSANSIATITNDSTNYGHAFGVSAGSTTVNACGGSVCGSAAVTVGPSTLISLTILPVNGKITLGSSEQFYAIGTFADGGSADVTKSVTWSSSMPAISTISPAGLAITTSYGNTIITAISGSVTASANFTVLPALVSITVTPQNISVPVGNTQQFTATGKYSDGSTIDLTSIVTWNSISPRVAYINSTGLALGGAQGTTIITASAGGLDSTATLTATPPIPTSIAVSPQTSSVIAGLGIQFSAIGIYYDGSTADLTLDAIWSSGNLSVATISSNGLATGRNTGNTTVTALYGTVSVSATLSVSAPMLVTVGTSPQSAFLPPGTVQQFTALGTNSDGSTQDITALVKWSSSNSVVATVNTNGLATAGTSGSTAISAMLNGVIGSTNVTVTVGGPPVIAASVSPSPNAGGWNNTNVTVNFTCTPGSAIIVSCPASQTAMFEGANQMISGTVRDAAGNTATASVTLNIDKTPPALVLSSPTDRAVLTNASLTITGTVSDSLSGIAALTCNQVPVTLSGGTFSCNISLNPGVNLIVVSVTDIAGNISLTKIHVTLNGPFPLPNSLQIMPGKVNLVVGDTQKFTVADELGRPRPDATWTVSDTNIATITTDASPVLTALAVGNVTLTATVQGVPTQIQVNILGASLSSGAARWSAPLKGFTAASILQAAPYSDDSPDLYSVEAGNSNTLLRALTADGLQLWQLNTSPWTQGSGTAFVPDGFGGVLALGNNSFSGIADFDAETGALVWQNNDFQVASSGLGQTENFAIRQDNAIAAVGGESLSLFDGNTGQRIQQTVLPEGIFVDKDSCGGSDQEALRSLLSPVTIDGNGTMYVLDVVQNETLTSLGPCLNPIGGTDVSKTTLELLEVSLEGSVSQQTLASDTYTTTSVVLTSPTYSGHNIEPIQVIPDGQGGALTVWTHYDGVPADFPFMVTYVSPNGATSTYELSPLSGLDDAALYTPRQVVLGENGVAFASSQRGIVSFNYPSGQISWVAQPSSMIQTLNATSEGGVTVADYYGDAVHVDSQGNLAGGTSLCGTVLSYCIPTPWSLGLWTSQMNGAVSLVYGPSTELVVSSWRATFGGRARVNAPPKLEFADFIPSPPGTQDNLNGNTAQKAGAHIIANGGPKNLVIHRIFADNDEKFPATIGNFLGESATPRDGFAFIGHSDLTKSVPPDAPYNGINYSIGLVFVDGTLDRTPVSNDPTQPFLNYSFSPPPPKTVSQIYSNAKIIFIGACDDFHGVLAGLWNINSQTQGRALVVPNLLTVPGGIPGAVDLWQATLEWEQIATNLASGKTLQQAVDAANQYLQGIASQLENPPQAWLIVGDANVQLKR